MPLERAVWWIEWILRIPDVEYLKSPVLRLGFVAGNSFDIIGNSGDSLYCIDSVLLHDPNSLPKNGDS